MKKKPCGEALRRRGVKHSNGINIDLLRQMLVSARPRANKGLGPQLGGRPGE
ncbi:unnamed protein product, partial [Ectocarpus sp. 6 AP-2014]